MNRPYRRSARNATPAGPRIPGDDERGCGAFAVVMLLLGLLGPATAFAQPVQALRVMMNPHAAAAGVSANTIIARLEARVGMKLTLIGTTRTGALDLALAQAVDRGALAPTLKRLREDRAVLWAEVPSQHDPLAKLRTKAASGARGQKLLLRLKDGVVPDWTTLQERFTQRLGVPVAMERQVGNVWVLRLAQAQPLDRLQELATALEGDDAVQYADPVLRRFAQAQPPDDPYFSQQWDLTDPLSGADMPAAWALQNGVATMTVAVVDTGILPHPDLSGRVLPGYDFISDPAESRDGDGRDPDPRDEGDWINPGDCQGASPADSSWHGTFVAGLIAAIPDNGIGIAGIDRNARILPVRTLGRCGGTDEDVLAGVLWASGVPIAGVPVNPNPAKVINMSLGGIGACSQALQEAVNGAMAEGTIVVVAAGNEADNVSTFSPANCSGVITVGAHNRQGERAFYSNFGRRIDISAPAGDGGSADAIVSLSNDGATSPGNPSYRSGVGTSFSAPLVAGTVSLMLGRNPTLTPGRVLSILQSSARSFAGTSPCRLGNLCGIGMLDAGLAIASTVPGTDAPPTSAVPVVEYYDAALDHYFITANPDEIASLDAFSGDSWHRTGYFFYAYPDPIVAPASARPVCRFYAGPETQIDSHFFTADPAECQAVPRLWPGVWVLETAAAFYIQVPDSAGNCPDGTLPVYRFFDNRRDANHRYSLDLSIRRTMINRAWIPEGNGANGVAFCSPI